MLVIFDGTGTLADVSDQQTLREGYAYAGSNHPVARAGNAGLAISCDGWLDPYYMYGAILVAAPSWAVGTALGVVVGNLLPARVVSALSVALYGMFLAIIIPPARKNKVVAALVLLSFALSFACGRLPLVSSLSSGTRTILLTVALSAGAALLFPVKDAEKEGNAP